jgi:hypothetical protein
MTIVLSLLRALDRTQDAAEQPLSARELFSYFAAFPSCANFATFGKIAAANN